MPTSIHWVRGGISTLEPASLLLIGVAWLCCGGLACEEVSGPQRHAHRLFSLCRVRYDLPPPHFMVITIRAVGNQISYHLSLKMGD